jgi:glutaredoxin 3
MEHHKIIVYSAPSCVYCKLAKKYFSEKGFKFEDKDVFSDTKARDEMTLKSGQMSVPVIDIDGQLVVGFDKGAINELLGL